MADFVFEAADANGRRVRGVERALDEAELDRRLRARDLLLLTAQAGRAPTSRRHTSRTLIDFCYHMATVIEAGIPLLEGLRDLQEGGRSAIAEELEDIARKVEAGQPLSDAMAGYPTLFPDLVRSLVAAGEASGHLAEIMRQLVSYLEWREDLGRKLRGAASYPCIVITGLIGLIILLTTVVLPKFLAIFVALDVELPFATRALIGFQHFAEAYGIHTLVFLAASGAIAVAVLRSESGRLAFDRNLLRLPVIGSVMSMIEMSRFSHNLGLLYRAGIPITRCLELIEEIVQNRAIRALIAEGREELAHGATLTQAFGKDALMPSMVVRMIALGESSGGLDRSLDHVANYYDREVPTVIDRSLALVNTGMVVAMGATLGTVAFAIFVPLYRMMGNLNA